MNGIRLVEPVACQDCDADTCHPSGRCSSCREALSPSREQILEAMGVPKVYRAPFEVARVREEALDALTWTGRPWALYLWGPIGSGKSMIAAHLLYRMGRGLWIVEADVPGAYYGGDPQRTKLDLERAPALVVDELGRGVLGKGSEAARSLIRSRWSESLPTIFTGNWPLERWRKEAPEVWDRLREGLAIEVPGPSQRRTYTEEG